MSVFTVLVVAALQAQTPAQQQAAAQLPPSPIAKLVVTQNTAMPRIANPHHSGPVPSQLKATRSRP